MKLFSKKTASLVKLSSFTSEVELCQTSPYWAIGGIKTCFAVCGGINPYTLMGLYGPHHQRWLGPQDEDVRRTTGRRAPQDYKILYQIEYFACNSVPSGYIRRGRGPLEDRSYTLFSQHKSIQSDAGRRYYAHTAAEPG